MNIQIDIRVMTRGYQKFKMALVKRSNGFVGGIYRLESGSLYTPGSKYVDLVACWQYVRSHVRIWNDTSYEKMSLCSLDHHHRLLLGGNRRDFSAAARLRPLPCSFWTSSAVMWRGLTSPEVLSAKSHRILSPVAASPVLPLLHHSRALDEPVETDSLKSNLFRARVAQRLGPTKSGLPRYVTRDVPDGRSNVQVHLSLWMRAATVYIDIYRRVYHAETRRKCSTSFVGTLHSLKATHSSVSVRISIRMSWKRHFSTGT